MTTLGLDVRPGLTRAVLADPRGVVLAHSSHTSQQHDGVAAVADVLQQTRSTDAQAPKMALGVATWLPAQTLPETLSSGVARLGLDNPVAIGAGAATVLAEAWCGAASGARDVVAFNLGEHVTSGALANGTLLRGSSGEAGSIAWLAINPVERDDYRRYGGLEAEVGAAGIVRRVVWRVKSGDHSTIVEAVDGDLSRITANQVLDFARSGDGVCVSVIRDTVKYVGMAVANLVTTLDPECVVFGGTLAASGPQMLEAIRIELGRRLRPAHVARLKLVQSTLGEDAVALGAARLAMLS
jgi:glucokinase